MLFSASGNKREVLDWDEIYTLKPYFTIFTAKKAGKNEWLQTKGNLAQKRPIHLAWKKVGRSPHLQ